MAKAIRRGAKTVRNRTTTKKRRDGRRRGHPARVGVWRSAFLNALREGESITESCRRARISWTGAHDARKRSDKFALEWDEAYKQGTGVWEDEVRRRALEGVAEPVFYEGKQVATVRKYSDNLLMFGLKKRDPSYRESILPAAIPQGIRGILWDVPTPDIPVGPAAQPHPQR